MALTTTQINQAYIAILGRAAIGGEDKLVAENASLSDVATSLIAAQATDATKEVDDAAIFQTLSAQVLKEATDSKLSNDDFVESLYTAFLNRGSDDEGKAFWLSVLNNGASREDLVASFTNAIISQKAANSQDYQNYAEQVKAKTSDFVESLYQNLLGRDSDEAGKAYWSSVIADGASYADVVASFVAAAASQGKGTEDGVAIANKLEVANYATTSIPAFSKVATKQNIADIKASIKQAIIGTNKNSTADTLAETKKVIDTEANTYKAPGSEPFTKSDKDKLGIDDNGDYSTTQATNFTGSLNISDLTKGTIQKTDQVFGNPEFAKGNILTVNVTGTTTKKVLDLNTLPTTVSGVENLEIKASAASVSGDISTNYKNTVTINAGYTGTDGKALASNITVKHALDTYNAGAKADQLTVESGASIENVNMGAGNDTIILQASNGTKAAAIVKNINGGTGNDTLQLTAAAAGTASGDYTTIESITGVKVIKLTGATDKTSGAQIDYDAIKESNKAFNITSYKADGSGNGGSGNLTITADDNTDIDVSKIVNGELGENGTLINKVASLTISNVKQGATIKLKSALGDTNQVDKITLNKEVVNGELGVTITNFASGDTIAVLKANGEKDDTAFAKLANGGSAYTHGSNTSGDLTTAVGSVKSVSVSNKGVLTFFDKASADSSGANEVSLTSVAEVQKVITELSASNKLFNGTNGQHVAVIVQIGKDAYIIETGASESITTDDTVIKLSGVIIDGTDITGIGSGDANTVTLV